MKKKRFNANIMDETHVVNMLRVSLFTFVSMHEKPKAYERVHHFFALAVYVMFDIS